MAIARVIHQLWKDDRVSDRYRAFRDTWARLHPGWEMRLWTDQDLMSLVETDYPHLAGVYKGYAQDICRADLGRYLVLHRFGGVYADLDCECLKPIDGLIDGAEFAIGVEPPIADAGSQQRLCPAFIASKAGHDFWQALFQAVAEASDPAEGRDATGSPLLTRLYRGYERRASIRILAADLLYPVSKTDCWNGRVHDLEFWEEATRTAHVLHYWDGGWFRGEIWTAGLPREVRAGLNDPSAPRADAGHGSARPKISCLLISDGALEPARRAIEAYLGQTYAARELVIVTRTPDRRLLDHLRAIDRLDIRLVRAEPGSTLGEQRNLGRDLARGEALCRWEEGDLHDPRRLEIQSEILSQTGANACLLRRWVAWRPAREELGIVDRRPLAASLLCLKSAMPDDPSIAGGPTDPVVDAFLGQGRVALVDLARLCVHIDGADGADDVLAIPFRAERYGAVLTELAKRLPVEARIRPRPADPATAEIEVRLFGAFGSTTGIGSSSRGDAEALAAAGVAFTVTKIHWPDSHPEPVPIPPPRQPGRAGPAWPVNLTHINPTDLSRAIKTSPTPLGLGNAERAFTIGIWAWETPNGVPRSWRTYYPTYDEIWAPSRHAAAAIARSAPVPVVVMSHVIAPPDPVLDRGALGFPQGAFVFLFAFDALSNVERKNPTGLIKAYLTAFPTPSPSVMLVLKTRSLRPRGLDRLAALAGGRADIRIVAEPWSGERMLSAMAACDAYVSLHRAEGFGRTMAEAMYYGKPVIATGYSGNMDFMSSDTAYLVPYELVALDAADGDYEAGSIWAEPNLEAAAALMAHVAANRAEASQVGARASRWVKTHLSAEAIGRRMRERLEQCRLESTVTPRRRRRAGADPSILILTSIKDGRADLAPHFERLQRLDYDPARLALGFIGDDRGDGHDALAQVAPALRQAFARIELHRPVDTRFDSERPPSIPTRRGETLARRRNRLVNTALGDEDHVLWLDGGVVDYPTDLLRQFLESEKDIVTAHCVSADGASFDLSTFRFSPASGGRDDPRYLVDGLFQPPQEAGRLYLDAFEAEDIVAVDAVGATALFIRADLHREGLMFPPFSYRGYIDAEGLAMMARDMGHACWGLPRLRVVH